MSDFQQEDDPITIEGFAGEKPKLASPPPVVSESVHRRSRRWVWGIASVLSLAVIGFGIYYYFTSQEVLVTGEVLYRPEVLTAIGLLERGPHVIPVAGAEVVVSKEHLVGIEVIMDNFHKRRSFSLFSLLENPRRYPNFASLPPEARKQRLQDWTQKEIEWNSRTTYCSQAVFQASVTKPGIILRTVTDAQGRFSFSLKPGHYVFSALSNHVPSFMSNQGKLSPVTGYAFWQMPVALRNL